MLALVLCSVIHAAGPRGPADFDQVIYLPRLNQATQFSEFLRVGGERSVLLRSENWREAVHPVLRFDITRPETAAAVGIDETGPLTLIIRKDLEVSCVTVKNLERFTAACADRIKALGTPFKKTEGGVTTVGARDALDRVLIGYVVKGNETCTARMQGKSVDAVLPEIAKWLGKTPATGTWKLLANQPGVGFLLTQRGVVAMNAEGLTASATARGELSLGGLAGGGTSPYGAMSMNALMVAKVRADPSATAPVLDEVSLRLLSLCAACEPGPFKLAARGLSPTLTGSAVLVVSKVKVTTSLRSEPGRFFALRSAMFAETHSPAEALKAIKELAVLRGAKLLEDGSGVSIILKEGEVRLGVRGTNVFASNDPTVLEAAYKALPTAPAAMTHGAEVSIDPKLLAQGLAQVPLMDAVQSTELAGALAAGAELGPLLLSTERISGWADAQRAYLMWKLKTPPAVVKAADAGVAEPAPADAGDRAP
ncbi:MAG: hypothetical protein IPJ65_12275 [Archangiaceae bacterium]|nr:hypothetical protein [Archangiaceae bacterium]